MDWKKSRITILRKGWGFAKYRELADKCWLRYGSSDFHDRSPELIERIVFLRVLILLFFSFFTTF